MVKILLNGLISMNNYYFTSDLHLSHDTLMRGYRGTIFSSAEEHNKTITANLLSLPRGCNLVIAGDLFWKHGSEAIKKFFDEFQKRKINIHIVYGNHDKINWFNHKAIKSQGHKKVFSIDKQPITVDHYNGCVWNKSHYNAWLLFGHTHLGDSTYEKSKQLSMFDTYNMGKKLNINIEMHNFKPWSFEEVKEHMDITENNWDFIQR